MKKIFIIVMLLVFCFGCTAKYKIEIKKDLSVDESITGLETDEFYAKFKGRSKNKTIDAANWNNRDFINKNSYKKEFVTEGDLYGEKIYKTYSSIDEYLDSSTVYKQLYDTFNHVNEDGIVTIELKDRLPINYDSLDRFLIDDAIITLVVPFKVIEHNADEVDKLSNEYTWHINKEDGKEIAIKFNSNKPLKDQNDYIIYIFIVLSIIIIIMFLYNFNNKRKKSNKI